MGDTSLHEGREEQRKPIVLRNGTLKDPVTGYFLSGPDAEHKPIRKGDSVAASALARRRHELAAIQARKALADVAEEKGYQRSPVAAVGLLARRAAEGALAGFEGEEVQLADGGSYNRRDLRGGKEAAKFALQLAGMLSPDERAVPAVAVQVNIGPELARAWAR